MAGSGGRLGDRLSALDATRFTGRGRVLARVDRLLDGSEPDTRVLHVHGPAGIGKSALLREITRRSAVVDRPVCAVDARTLDPTPGDLERALGDAFDRPGAVVLLDSYEHVRALDSLLRDRIVPRLPGDASVFVAGREPPRPEWFRDGWEHVVNEVELGPLTRNEVTALLEGLGVDDPADVAALADWAAGSPLALALGASQLADRRVGVGISVGGGGLDGMDLERVILRRLAGDDLADVDRDVLAVAAVARACDARLLAAVLPGRPTRTASEALRRSRVAELVGARVTLHDLVRTVLRENLRTRDPRHYHQLRCALADHLVGRIADGEAGLLLDLIGLIDRPDVRWGIGGDAGRLVRIDPWIAAEADPFVKGYVERMDGRRHWESLAPLLAETPELGLVARDVDGAPLGFCVATPALDAPAVVRRDPVLAPTLADARAVGDAGCLIYRETSLRPDAPDEAAFGVLTLAAILRSRMPNVVRSYVLDTKPNPDSMAFFAAVGATRRPDLDAALGDDPIACWLIDHGDGLPSEVRNLVYEEAGRPPPTRASRHTQQLLAAAVDTLRSFDRPDILAANPLTTLVGDVGSLRDAIVAAVAVAFGPGESDRHLRRVVELGDLDPTVSTRQAAAQLNVSRATYFRHLREARERVAGALVEQFGGYDPAGRA